MLCERCKIREANIQYTEVINGTRTEHHFCAQCARELDFGQYSAIFDGEFPFAEFLSALLGGESPAQKQEKYQQIVCPTCGMTYEEFVKNSCFGCADCYGVFGKRPAYQGAGADAAKETVFEKDGAPQDEVPVQEKIRSLERRLKDALRTEEYETAAWCRDQIRALKEGAGQDD